MECKITSTNDRPRAGMTLVEMMMGLGVGGLVLAAVMGTSTFTSRSFVAMGNYCDLNASGRNSLDSLSQDVRQADFLASYTTNSTSTTNALIFQTTDPISGAKFTLAYTYDSRAQTLTRSISALGSAVVTNTMLLTNCAYFHYDLYQRNPALTNGGDLVFLISTNQPSLVKALDLTWVCSRTVMGMTYNSEDVQASRVVIRKN